MAAKKQDKRRPYKKMLSVFELDDKSHQRQDRRERDAFVDQVFKAAGLPLLHVPARRGYVAADLAANLAPFIGGIAPSSVPAEAPDQPVSTEKSPQCPKCGDEMILRIARSGANAGSRFWGCSNYPTCRAILPHQG